MDIYTYQKLYHNPEASEINEPLPHLFIISDEFAELKKQEPDFMDQLISAARIGRSLGVHLILATQKPSGVVDDQIWSNTKFRVCLRVQDRGDSFEMLKRPEAAELRDTGRFYLQVGYNEYFALGQSAYCGADYIAQTEVVVQKDDVIQVVDPVGQNIQTARPDTGRLESDTKQIMAIVQYLSDVADKANIKPRPLWTAPLRKQIIMGDLIDKYKIPVNQEPEVVIGMVDDPGRQIQFPLTMNLYQSRNLLIAGESGSGKTTMLQTILYYVATRYRPEDVSFYILDFSSRNLGVFRNLPHCGAFLTDQDEDKLDDMFALIRNTIDERRKLFAEAEVSSFEAYREIAPLPLILFVIDNVSQFEEYEGGYQRNNTLGDLMRNGVGYGIKTIFTLSQINDCPMRLRREAGNKIALRARDRYAYSDILDCRCKYEPVDTPGRGICVIEDECFEFQTALAVETQSEKQRIGQIREELQAVVRCLGEERAIRKLITEAEQHNDGEYKEFCAEFSQERVPLGYTPGKSKNIAIPLQQIHCVSLYFGNSVGITPIMTNLFFAFHRENSEIFVVRRTASSIFPDKDDATAKANGVTLLDSSPEDVRILTERVYSVWLKNKAYCDEYCRVHNIENQKEPEAVRQWRKFVRENSRPLMVVFESLYDTVLTLDAEGAADLTSFFPAILGMNIYFWGMFYPDDEERVKNALYPNGTSKEVLDTESKELTNWREIMTQITEPLQEEFNPEKLALLFGGQFHKQRVTMTLPDEWQAHRDPYSPEDLNQFLLLYHNKAQKLTMPCGNLTDLVGEADDQEII